MLPDWTCIARNSASATAKTHHDWNTSPTNAARIAAARKGKKRPHHVIKAMREGRTGKLHDAETRWRMSEAHRKRGTRPPKAGHPWTAAADELVRTRPVGDIVRATGRSQRAVYTHRSELKLPDWRRTSSGNGTDSNPSG
jgi:hypothetical protein